MFRADGKLDFIEDPNGNRITAGYDGVGILLTLTHSSGPTLTFSYNANGRLEEVNDDAGRTTTYAYDTAGEHLVSVTEQLTAAPASARSTTYSYVTGHGDAREHALESIAFADGTHLFYEYDSQGRVIEKSRDGGAETVSLTYDNDAGVTFTNVAGTTTLLFNDFGRAELVHDPLGRTSQLDYDSRFNLVQFVSAAGSTSTFNYDATGNLIRMVDPLGFATDFTYESQFNQLKSFRDARGNTTRYEYNAQGNLLAIV
jgi:YD repeat-containing protein